MKTCIKCKETKPYTDYHKARSTVDKRQSSCKLCDNARRNASYQSDPNRSRVSSYKVKYGLTIEGYDTILKNQNGCCAICGTSKNIRIVSGKEQHTHLVVDHCHITGKVRGLLCYTCNVGLGMFRDNTEYLKTAIEYLDVKDA